MPTAETLTFIFQVVFVTDLMAIVFGLLYLVWIIANAVFEALFDANVPEFFKEKLIEFLREMNDRSTQ